MSTDDFDRGDDLKITSITPREGALGKWIEGTIAGHCFHALVFADHAENPEWELGDSRTSKLWVQRQTDNRSVFNWDRGADVPATDDLAQAIVDFLAAGLVEHIEVIRYHHVAGA